MTTVARKSFPWISISCTPLFRLSIVSSAMHTFSRKRLLLCVLSFFFFFFPFGGVKLRAIIFNYLNE